MTGPCVVVIGAGLAGLTVAAGLLQEGVHVEIVEAGADEDLEHEGWSRRKLGRWRPWNSATPPHFQIGSGLKRRVGGRSLSWHGIVLPIEEWALRDWPESIRGALCEPYDGSASLYDITTTMLVRWAGAPLTAWCSDGVAIADRVARCGDLETRVVPRAIRGEDRPLHHATRWRAYSPLFTDARDALLLATRRDFHVLEVTANSTVEVVGSQSDGSVQILRADAIVVAAGAIESARLACNLAPAAAPSRAPLSDHTTEGLFFSVAACRAADLGFRPGLVGEFYFPSFAPRSNAFLEVIDLIVDGRQLLNLWTCGEHDGTGTVDVSMDKVCAAVAYEPAHSDAIRSRAERAALVDLAARIAGADTVRMCSTGGGATEMSALRNCTTDPLAFAPYSRPIGASDHDSCALGMGGEHVDDTGESRSTPGVFFAGPALFPRAGSANPALTSLALSHRVVSQIVRLLDE